MNIKWYKERTQNDNKELQNAYIQYHSPWITEEEKVYWKVEIKRLHSQQLRG